MTRVKHSASALTAPSPPQSSAWLAVTQCQVVQWKFWWKFSQLSFHYSVMRKAQPAQLPALIITALTSHLEWCRSTSSGLDICQARPRYRRVWGLHSSHPHPHNLTMQVLRNLHREVMELNSELNLLKKTVFLSERELEEYQLRTEDCQYEVINIVKIANHKSLSLQRWLRAER